MPELSTCPVPGCGNPAEWEIGATDIPPEQRPPNAFRCADHVHEVAAFLEQQSGLRLAIRPVNGWEG